MNFSNKAAILGVDSKKMIINNNPSSTLVCSEDYPPNCNPEKQNIAQSDKGEQKIKRSQFNCLNYFSFVFAATLHPILNLLILYTQSYNLSWSNNFASINRSNFQFYYISIAYYLASVIVFVLCSAETRISFKEIIKLYSLVDSNKICAIAAIICYIALHLVFLCRDLAGDTYNISAIDIILLIVFALNKFTFLGHFRTSLVCYKWTTTETLTFKILIFASSMTYFAYGIMLIVGSDNLSQLMNRANNIVQAYVQSTDFGNLTAEVQKQLLKQISNLSSNITIIQNLISLFVFTSFANICQVLNRMNDFDKSSDLKPMYMIDDDQQESNDPYIQQFKNEMNHKLEAVISQIRSFDIIKDAISSKENMNFRSKYQITNRQFSIEPPLY